MLNWLRNLLRKWLGIYELREWMARDGEFVGTNQQMRLINPNCLSNRLDHLNTAIVEQGKSFDKRCEQLGERLKRVEIGFDIEGLPHSQGMPLIYTTPHIASRLVVLIDRVDALESRNNSAASLVKELNGKAPKKPRTRAKKGR